MSDLDKIDVPDGLLLTDEVASKLRVNVQWIYAKVRQKKLHPYKLSRVDWRWHWETVLVDLKKMP
ncbi:MAG: hypothetical protein ACLQVY_20305 [Limisphaerales bacterium]